MRHIFLLIGLVSVCLYAGEAQDILSATGVKGGLIVHLGCGEGRLTAELGVGERYVVQGLDADPANVAAARKHIQSLGLYGRVSARVWDAARLPYADNLANLVVAESTGKVTLAEVLRVLAPKGVAYVKQGGAWTKTVKPRPDDIDEWSHFLHDASNNAVAADTKVGPPRRLQWSATPLWCRSHEFISSFCALVSAGGRVFYIMDEAISGVTDRRVPEKWVLTARDAFNGVSLWRMPVPEWRLDGWQSTSMRGRPPSVPRRMVADARHLYITLSQAGGVSVLDAATGETVRTVPGTEGAQEMVLVGRTLVVRLTNAGDAKRAGFAAVDADTGDVLWHTPGTAFQQQSLAAADGRVVYSTGKELVCLDLADGKEAWRATSFPPPPKPAPNAKKKPRRGQGYANVILHGDQALVTNGGTLVAHDAKTGAVRWQARAGGGAMQGQDFFVAQGLAWHAATGGIAGYDLKTGTVAKTIDPSSVQSRGHHLRCYRAKATEQYLITQFRGAEFVSLSDENHSQNDWVRGPCRYGVLPCNGLFYAPPHQCFCYTGAMVSGFNAYTTASDAELKAIVPQGVRLQRGPAYDTIGKHEAVAGDWPMYRHDARRSGSASCKVEGSLDTRWRVKLGGRLTPPVCADGRVVVADKDRHTVIALGDGDGKEQWRFTADGPIDSAPTYFYGQVLFGCADGHVYCLRARDGVLAWRFRAAPAERLIVDEGRVESAWRVHGSVIVEGGVVYAAAGRSSFVDGGLYLVGLDPRTGKVLHEGRLNTLMATREDAKGEEFLPAFHIQGTRSDLLVAEGGHIYMNQMKWAPDLTQVATKYVSHEDSTTEGLDVAKVDYVAENPYLKKGFASAADLGVRRGHMGDQEVGLHLFSTGGFLDDSWFNRTFWMYAKTWPGYQLGHIAPKTGQLVVMGDEVTYAVQAYPTRNVHSAMFTPGSKGYLLMADRNDNEPALDRRSWARDKGMGFTRTAPPVWHQWVPVRMRAMVLAGNRLFVAGPPDEIVEDDPMAAFEGRRGAVLWAFSAADGKKADEHKLDSPPVFDGLIAANGRLYLTLRDGTVACMR